MKLRVYSDIHLDHYKNVDSLWYPPYMPDNKDTTLVLAGDIWIGTKFIEYAGFSWIQRVANRFKEVIVVLGNHDYWPTHNKLTTQKGGEKCNAMLQDRGITNVHVLDMNTHQDGEYLFVGCTLWSDMKNMDPLVMWMMPRMMAYDGDIAYETGEGLFLRMTSERWVHTHIRHRNYIEMIARQNQDKKIVVVTHHVPVLGVGDPSFVGHDSNWYYMSDLSELIIDNPNIVLWAHGHTHHHQHETAVGNAIVMNNCMGYPHQKHEEQGYVQHKVIEI